jgi:hypothetical protein
MSSKNLIEIVKVDSVNSVDHSKHQSLKSKNVFKTDGKNSKLEAVDAFLRAQNTLKGSAKAANISISFNKNI